MEDANVLILLSTYNAENYLREQLDSLLKQTYPNITILIRDDGSKDGTIAILEEYTNKYRQIAFYQGENLGASGSFFELMKKVRYHNFAYCAFCDQDDYWLANKVEMAVRMLKENTSAQQHPLLYCGKTQLTDATLKPLDNQIKRDIHPAFSNALIENVVTGCTTVLNRAMYHIMLRYIPDYCIMHDWWMYLVATATGHVIYDDTPYILYRQHGNNVMGIDGTYATEMKNRAAKYQSRKSNIVIQAQEWLRLAEQNELKGQMPENIDKPAKRKYISKISPAENIRDCYKKAHLLANYKSSLSNRIRIAFGGYVFRQRPLDNLIFRILFLFGLR